MALTKVPSNLDAAVSTTQSQADNSTKVATTAYVDLAISNLSDSAPAALNTLNEIAAALGDDANYASTTTAAIAAKAPLASPSFTGTSLSLKTTSSTANDRAGAGFNATESSTDSSRRATMYLDADNGAFGTGDSGAYFYMEKKGGGGEVNFINQDNAALNFQIGGASKKLTISGNNLHLNGGTDARIQLGTSGAGATSTSNDTVHIRGDGDSMKLMTAANGHYIFEENGTEHFRIKSGGNVGIGENNPANKLHVKVSDAGIVPHPSAQLVLERDGTNYLQFLTTAAGTSGLLFGDTNDIDVSKIYVDHNTTKMTFVNETVETMVLHGANVGIGENTPAATLHVEHTSGTAYNGTSEILESAIISNKNGTDNSGVNNVASIGLHVADGATSQGFINYVRTGNNTGKFTFSQRIASGTYRENFRIENDKTYSLFPILQGGVSSSVGIGSTMADVNGAELGPGYLNLARDDTADAKQISFSKNGVRVSDISTTDKGILWEVLESSGNAAAFQMTNGVGHSVWSTMNAQGHKWQDNVYNALSAGGVSIGTDSSNTSHMWWNVYDTGSKHAVSAGYGMDQYVSITNGDWVTRFSDNSSFIGDGVTLTSQLTVKRTGHMHVGQSTSDVLLYVGSAGGAFGGNSTNNMRAAGSTLMFNSAGTTMNFEIQGSQKGYLGSNGWVNGSDRSLKENIEDITYGLDTVKLLRPRKFDWIDAPDETKNSIGFIAQEVETVIPEIISEAGTTPKKGMNYGVLTSVLVKAIQEQQTIIEDLKSRIETLEG